MALELSAITVDDGFEDVFRRACEEVDRIGVDQLTVQQEAIKDIMLAISLEQNKEAPFIAASKMTADERIAEIAAREEKLREMSARANELRRIEREYKADPLNNFHEIVNKKPIDLSEVEAFEKAVEAREEALNRSRLQEYAEKRDHALLTAKTAEERAAAIREYEMKCACQEIIMLEYAEDRERRLELVEYTTANLELEKSKSTMPEADYFRQMDELTESRRDRRTELIAASVQRGRALVDLYPEIAEAVKIQTQKRSLNLLHEEFGLRAEFDSSLNILTATQQANADIVKTDLIAVKNGLDAFKAVHDGTAAFRPKFSQEFRQQAMAKQAEISTAVNKREEQKRLAEEERQRIEREERKKAREERRAKRLAETPPPKKTTREKFVENLRTTKAAIIKSAKEKFEHLSTKLSAVKTRVKIGLSLNDGKPKQISADPAKSERSPDLSKIKTK